MIEELICLCCVFLIAVYIGLIMIREDRMNNENQKCIDTYKENASRYCGYYDYISLNPFDGKGIK